MAGSSRFEIDGVLNTSGIAKGAQDGKKALADLESAVGDVGDESARSGGKVDSFAAKLVDASRKAGKSDDDIKDALRGMGLSARQAEEAVEDIGDEFKATGREGDRAAEKLEDSLKDVQRQAGKTADEVGDVGGKGFGKMGDAAKEVTQELGQNLGETVSSIRGDLSDLGQVGQDTLGGLAASLAGSGPAGIVGAAALAAGAVGLGLVTAELQKQQEEADRMRERIAAAYQGAAEDGRTFIDSQQIIADGLDLIFNPDRADEYKKVVEDATRLGVDLSDVIAARNGDMEAQKTIQAEINKLLEDSNSYEQTGTTNKKTLKSDVADLKNRWQEVVDTTNEYAEKTQVAADVTSDMLLKMIGDAGTAQEEVDALNNKLITLPSGEKIVIDAETGKAHQDIDRFKGDTDGVIDQLNGRDVVLEAQASVAAAERDITAFVGRKRAIKVDVTVGGIASALKGWDK